MLLYHFILLYYYIHYINILLCISIHLYNIISNITIIIYIVFKKAPSSHHQSVNPPSDPEGVLRFFWHQDVFIRSFKDCHFHGGASVDPTDARWICDLGNLKGLSTPGPHRRASQTLLSHFLFCERADSPLKRSHSCQGVLLP